VQIDDAALEFGTMSTILIVEDEIAIRQEICEHLEGCGFAVLQAESASGAISKIMRHPEIALVFTDIRMPGAIDGYDLAMWIRLNHSNIIVMITTGGFGRKHAKRDLFGAEIFPKPYLPQKVSDRIRQVLEASTAS
jgi:two-component system, response regulator PdtaR